MELTWKQFREKKEIKDLPLNEQVRQYSFYLDTLSNELYRQSKGPSPIESRYVAIGAYSGYLLQENYDYILQEDGSRIYL